jgi:methionyl-tRNA synthetase
MSDRRILVTAALPYANGPIHLGHLVEYVQTDIWVRRQRLAGRRTLFVCADDTHGAAVMMRARQEGRPESELIEAMREAHLRDFTGFEIRFDHYGSTHSEANRALCGEFWAALRRAGLVEQRDVTQLYDPQAKLFLADRFVRGECPKCGAADQYGDSCDKCGATYAATELVNPRSVHSGATPELRSAAHLFITTERAHEFLEEYTQRSGALTEEVARWLAGSFLGEPLRDWDVSRPAPYFGFEIPDSPGDFWYVWFDAPIGYLAATREWCDRNGERFDDWWKSPATEVHHFIGKDITYFHTLFWPVMLRAAGFNLPRAVHIHGFLTVDGAKMSKTKGTFVKAETYLSKLDPAWLRYYYASKLGPRLDDLDLNLDEFVAKVNGDLVGKLVNLASRTARFVEKTGLSATYPDDGGLFAGAAAEGASIGAAYDALDYNRAVRLIMALADRANKFVEDREPWKLAKDPARAGELQDVCTTALNLYWQLIVYLAPVLPRLAERSAALLHQRLTSWEQAATPVLGTPVAKYEHLMTRADRATVDAVIEASRASAAPAAPQPQPSPAQPRQAQQGTTVTEPVAGSPGAASETPAGGGFVDGPEPLAAEPLAAMITIDDFTKVDLRVARVLAAEEVPGAKKLLRLTLSLGGEERRNVFAGIKAAYAPEKLVGRLVIMVANLQPRQMTFGLSEGMVVAVGPGGPEVFLLSPDEGAKPGMRAH